MPVTTQNPINSSLANGVATVFPYQFLIPTVNDIAVEINGVLQSSGYTVSGAGNPAGGNITFAVAPGNGSTVVRYRDLEYKRDFDWTEGGDLLALTHDANDDYVVMLVQQLAEAVGRSPGLPRGHSLAGLITLPVPGAGKYLRWNLAGTALEAVTSMVEAGTFLASGAGAVEQEVEAKLGQHVNALDYMTDAQRSDIAARTYLLDCTQALRNALAAAQAVGLPLRIPAGGYRVEDLNYPGGQTPDIFGILYVSGQPIEIHGDGPQSTIIKCFGAISSGIRLSTNTGHSRVANLQLDMGGTTGAGVLMVAQSCDVDNLLIQNISPPGCAISIEGSTLSVVNRLTTANVANGIMIGQTTLTNYVKLRGLHMSPTSGYAIKCGFTAAPVGQVSQLDVYGLYFEDGAPRSILIERCNSVHLRAIGAELTDETTLVGNGYIRIYGCYNVTVNDAYLNHYGTPNKWFFEIDDCDNFRTDGVYARTEEVGMTVFRFVTTGSSGISLRNTVTLATLVPNAVSLVGIYCDAACAGLEVLGWTDLGYEASHRIDAARTMAVGVTGPIDYDARDGQVFINCQGAHTGAGVDTALRLNSDGAIKGIRGYVRQQLSSDRGDAAVTLTPGTDVPTQIFSTPLTAPRAVALSTTGAINGTSWRIVREATATGASALNVGTGPLKALAVGQWCEVAYNSSVFKLTAFGAL